MSDPLTPQQPLPDEVREAAAIAVDPTPWAQERHAGKPFADDPDAQARYEGFYAKRIQERKDRAHAVVDAVIPILAAHFAADSAALTAQVEGLYEMARSDTDVAPEGTWLSSWVRDQLAAILSSSPSWFAARSEVRREVIAEVISYFERVPLPTDLVGPTVRAARTHYDMEEETGR